MRVTGIAKQHGVSSFRRQSSIGVLWSARAQYLVTEQEKSETCRDFTKIHPKRQSFTPTNRVNTRLDIVLLLELSLPSALN